MGLQEVLALSAVCSAIAKPPLVVFERANLLTVVVWHRVGKCLLTRIGPHLLHVSKEFSILKVKFSKFLA